VSPHLRSGFGLPELLVAITIMGIGIVAVAGLVVTTGYGTRAAASKTDQIIVAQQELERATRSPFDSLVSAIDSTTTSLGSYALDRSVIPLGPRIKRLDLTTSGIGSIPPLTMTIVIARPATLP
jgi:prepilin-type N-terminal cleavage/methylation domain-containing protein